MSFLRLSRLLNLKTPLTEEAIDEIAEEIYRNYPFFRMSDICLIIWRIKTGKCGELYESLNIAKVLRWVNDYAEERYEECARLSLTEHQQIVDNYKRYSETNQLKEFLTKTKNY